MARIESLAMEPFLNPFQDVSGSMFVGCRRIIETPKIMDWRIGTYHWTSRIQMIQGLLQWGDPYIQKFWMFYDVFVFDLFYLKIFVQICLNGCFAKMFMSKVRKKARTAVLLLQPMSGALKTSVTASAKRGLPGCCVFWVRFLRSFWFFLDAVIFKVVG